MCEILKRIANGGLEPGDVRELLQGVLDAQPPSKTVAELPQARYTSPTDQIMNLREWNRVLGFIWKSEAIDLLEGEVPDFSIEEPLIPLTLCWTLNTLASSIDAKIDIMCHVYGKDNVVVTHDFNPDEQHTSVVRGRQGPWDGRAGHAECRGRQRRRCRPRALGRCGLSGSCRARQVVLEATE